MKLHRISIYFFVILFLLSIAVTCTRKTEIINKNDFVIENTLDSAIRYFTYDAMDSSILNHFDFFPDNMRNLSSIILRNISEKDSSLSVEHRILALKLSTQILDTVSFTFQKDYPFSSNIIIEDDFPSKNRTAFEKNLKRRYFGSINLSDPVFSEDKQSSCYYFALNCVYERNKGCTFSAVVFSTKRENKWTITHMIMLSSS